MAKFQIGNQNALKEAVNKNISKRKKQKEEPKRENKTNEIANRKSQQPIYNITSTSSGLNRNQIANNLQSARNVVESNKRAISKYKESQGITQNRLAEMNRDTLLRPQTNKKMTPIKEQSRNAWEAGPQNASQILQNKVEKTKELLNTEEGQDLQTSLRQSQNVAAYEKYNYNQKLLENYKGGGVLDNTIGSFIRGASSLFDNMDEENFVYDDDGNRRKLAGYSELKQQKNQENQGFLGKIVSSTFNNLGRVLGSAAIDSATLGVGGKAIYWGDSFFDSYNQNLNDGYDEASSATSAILTTGLGAVIDKLLGSAAVNVVGNTEAAGLEDVVRNFLMNKNVNKKVANYISSMSSEGLSEFVEEFADAYINKFTLDKSTDPSEYMRLILETFPAALESGLVGSLSGGIGTANEQLQSSSQYKSLNNYIDTLEKFTPTTITEANMKEEALSDALQQRNDLEDRWGFGEKKEQQTKQTNKEMEQEATEALEKRKQEQNTMNTTQQEEVKTEKPKQEQKKPEVETKTNYNIPEAKNPDKIVAKITENSTPEVKKQTEQLLSEPSKNKQTVNIGDGRTVTTPSETTREGGLEAASKYIKDSVPQKEVKQIQREDKKRRKSLDNMYEKALNSGDTERAAYIKELRDNDLYTVEHSGYEVFKETMKLLEDPENYYKQYSEKLNSTTEVSTKELTKLEYMQTALYKYYADYNSPSYNPTMANSLLQDWAEEGTAIGQALAARRQMYNDDPNHVAIRTQQTLNSMFREEAKNHEGDVDWLNKNDPMKNPDSPYHMSDTQLVTVNYYANKLSKIEDKSSIEYLTTYSQLDNYIQSLFGDKKLTDKMKRLTITNVLASTRIWTQNIKGNFINLAQFNGIDKLVATGVDKIISIGTPLTQGKGTNMRSLGMSFEGDREFIKGYKQGIVDSWSEFKNDITLSKFHSKYTDSESTEMGDLGKKGFGKTFNDETKVGHALNRYQDLINFALDIGDRPFAQGYYAQSIHNQRMLNAQIDAQASGKNTVYYTSINDKTKMYEVRYFDPEGRKINTFMTEDQYKNFSETAVEEELTEQMCNIAEKEALENTYQDDNKITRAALKMKDSLNDIFTIGDFGFGDMILKFTRTGSNMAKSLYEHSPLAAAQLVKDVNALNRNIKAGTETIEMQHKVAREAGKLLGGAITMSIVAGLDWAGLIDIEGEHDDDKEDKFKESILGSQEYSFELPGGEYRYNISNDSTLGSLARLGKTAEELAKDGNNIIEVLANMTAPFTNEIIDNSFMSSVLDLGSSYSDPLDNLARKVASQPSNLIPSFMKDASFTIDNFAQRNTYDENLGQYMINQIINKTPLRGFDIELDTPIGKIKGLSSKKTAWGEVRTVGGDTLASVWNTWLTADTLSKIKNDDISNEVVRVYTETNNTNSIPNLNTTKNFSYNGTNYDLNEKEQDKYMTTYGKTSYNAVRDLMKTNQYKNASDEQKVKLLEKAYGYAKEKAIQNYVESKGKTYYNYNKKDNKYTEYKKPIFEEIIDNDISIEEASYKRKYNNSYKLKTSITGLENYQNIAKDIQQIKKAYSTENGFDYKTKKYAVQTYINELKGLTSVQKAMLSKLEQNKGDYSNYDDKILSYIKSLDLTDEEYQYMYKELGLGGYWSMYYKTKKNK